VGKEHDCFRKIVRKALFLQGFFNSFKKIIFQRNKSFSLIVISVSFMKNGDNRMKKLNTAIALALGIASTSAFAQEATFSANTSANAPTSASLSLTSSVSGSLSVLSSASGNAEQVDGEESEAESTAQTAPSLALNQVGSLANNDAENTAGGSLTGSVSGALNNSAETAAGSTLSNTAAGTIKSECGLSK
jgi:hypothetical protein